MDKQTNEWTDITFPEDAIVTEEQREFKKIFCNCYLRVRFSIIEKIKRKEKASNFSVFSGRFDTSDGSPKVLIIGPAEINDFLPVST